ncbi:MAG TPA: nickel insertion protein, partial [Ktedonobacteraceae bacterium]
MGSKIVYLDCLNGISGPLLLAALLDTGLPLSEIQQQLQMLSGVVSELHCEMTRFKGLRGMKCHIAFKEANVALRSLSDCISLLQASHLAPQIATRALSVMQRLRAAEETVRGAQDTPEPLHPALALLEVVSVVSALSLADIGQVYAS